MCVPRFISEGQKTTLGFGGIDSLLPTWRSLSPSNMGIPELELGLSGWTADNLTHWAVLSDSSAPSACSCSWTLPSAIVCFAYS